MLFTEWQQRIENEKPQVDFLLCPSVIVRNILEDLEAFFKGADRVAVRRSFKRAAARFGEICDRFVRQSGLICVIGETVNPLVAPMSIQRFDPPYGPCMQLSAMVGGDARRRGLAR